MNDYSRAKLETCKVYKVSRFDYLCFVMLRHEESIFWHKKLTICIAISVSIQKTSAEHPKIVIFLVNYGDKG